MKKQQLVIYSQGVIIYFSDGTQTDEFAKTKIKVLEQIEEAHDKKRIDNDEQYSLWFELYELKELPTESEWDDLLLFLLIYFKGYIETIYFSMCDDHSTVPHGHIIVFIEHKPTELPVIVESKKGGRAIVDLLHAYKLISKQSAVLLKKSINSAATLIEDVKSN